MSSSKPGNGRTNRYTEEQKRDIMRRCEDSDLSDVKFAKQEGVSTHSLHTWRKRYGRKARKVEQASVPDHERDIAQLAVLNSHPVEVPGSPSDASIDERLAKVLGATIAEVILRLQGRK